MRKNFLRTSLFILLLLGIWSCGPLKKISLDPESEEFYKTAQLIMTKQEKEIFTHLPDKESRQEFISEFWSKRDPNPDTNLNEFKEEFQRRVEYASKRFREGIPGWKTDRGRIYIIFGPPDKTERNPVMMGADIKGLLMWVYYRYDFAVEFVDRKGNGIYTLDPYSGIHGNFFYALDRLKLGQTPREGDSLEQRFIDFVTNYDTARKQIVISVPVKSLIFKDEEGLLKADFVFEFFIHEKQGTGKWKFTRTAHFERPEDEVLQMKEVSFSFPFDLSPGEYYFDTVISGEVVGKARKIFEISLR